VSTDPEQQTLEARPVAAGVRALLVVAVVGAIVAAIALAILVKTSSVASDRASFEAGMTLSMPAFTSAPAQLEPVVLPSLSPSDGPSDDYSPSPDSSYPPVTYPSGQAGAYPINLQAGERNVTILLDLSGTYAKGEGAVLQVQQNVHGTWTDFTPPGQTGQFVVGGGLFSGAITPQGTGPQQFRVRNISNSDVSNAISVVVS
jgi:hypothetical protein